MPIAVAAPTPAVGSATEFSRRPRTGAEAARYTVLRRLAPALKHDMVVNLQAVSMMAEVLSARLEKGLPASAEFQTNISKINRLARDAVSTCLKVTEWIEPAEDEGVWLREGVQECVTLLQSSFNFRGFSISNDVPEAEFEVSRVALRNLLVASLIALTDAAPGPCDVLIAAEIVSGFAVLTVRCAPRDEDGEGLPSDVGYRQLEWSDVQALAVAESVELFRTSEQIVIRMPRLIATSPLQIVPL